MGGPLDAGLAAPGGDLQGTWKGTCNDDGKVADVEGEVCLRGAGDGREISIWGGGWRLLQRPNSADETVKEERTIEVVVNRWDENARTFSFDRNRLVWRPGENEPSSVVHRVQTLKLVGTDGMDEVATETTVRAGESKRTSFTCALKRVSRTVSRTGRNGCPAK